MKADGIDLLTNNTNSQKCDNTFVNYSYSHLYQDKSNPK
jgi:hypothetical protein